MHNFDSNILYVNKTFNHQQKDQPFRTSVGNNFRGNINFISGNGGVTIKRPT